MNAPPSRLRPATLDDVPQMAEIERRSFTDAWPASAFTTLLSMAYARLTVAERALTDRANEIVGYCVIVVAADEGEIANIAVREQERGTGVGARLLDHAIAEVTGDGVCQLFLEVREANASAIGLYTSRGFVQVGRRREYYRAPVEDALVLRWQQPARHDP